MAQDVPHVQYLDLANVEFDENNPPPAVIAPLVDAAKSGRELRPAMAALMKSLGFNTFMYGLSASLRPGLGNRVYTFTTLPLEWVRHWDQHAYIEVDPRIQAGHETTLPFLWDQPSERGKSKRLDQFLDDAARYDTRSGVSLVLPDAHHASVIVAFNSEVPVVDHIRRAMIYQNIGDLFTFGYYFHELFMKQVVHRGVAPFAQGAPVSPREREVLAFAIKGLTNEDIGFKLGIRARTVQFHFDSLRTKLNANTREEAVYLATRAGLLE